jgi:hypothetical protein
MGWEPGFDRCHKCPKVTVGIWQGRGKTPHFTCLSCFGKLVRRLVKAERGPNSLRPRRDF